MVGWEPRERESRWHLERCRDSGEQAPAAPLVTNRRSKHSLAGIFHAVQGIRQSLLLSCLTERYHRRSGATCSSAGRTRCGSTPGCHAENVGVLPLPTEAEGWSRNQPCIGCLQPVTHAMMAAFLTED